MTSPCDSKQQLLVGKVQALMERFKEKSAALANEVRQEAEGLDPDLDTTGLDVWIGIDFDVTWKRQDMSLDLPQVKLVDQSWSLDLPQVTVKNEDIIFHTPSVRMVTKKVGEYPEVTCGGFPPQCTVRWSPIYADVPEPFMQEQRIVIGVPEFKMDRTEFVLGVPEFSMKRVDFSLDLPEITVKNISVEAKKAEEKGQALAASASERNAGLQREHKESAKAELGQDVAGLFDCYFEDLNKRKNGAMEQFAQSEAMMQGAISGMLSQKVPDDNAALVRVRASLADLQQKRADFASMIEGQLNRLLLQQQSFIDKLMPA